MDLKNENVRIVQSCRVCEYLQTPVVVNVASDPEPVLHEHIAQALLKSVRVKDAVTTTCQATGKAAASFLNWKESPAVSAFTERSHLARCKARLPCVVPACTLCV